MNLLVDSLSILIDFCLVDQCLRIELLAVLGEGLDIQFQIVGTARLLALLDLLNFLASRVIIIFVRRANFLSFLLSEEEFKLMRLPFVAINYLSPSLICQGFDDMNFFLLNRIRRSSHFANWFHGCLERVELLFLVRWLCLLFVSSCC